MKPSRATLWLNRSFILLALAYFISAFGDHVLEAAIMKEMGIEGSAAKTRISAQMLFFFFLPYVLLGPLAGAIADRLPRRLIMITADVVRAALVLMIPLYLMVLDQPAASGWLMMLPILGLGVGACFFNPARQALVPQVVEDAQLTRANSALNGLAPIASIISFVIGGYLAALPVVHIGPWSVRGTTVNFACGATTFLVSAALVAAIVVGLRAPPPTVRPMHQEIALGFQYLRAHRRVMQLMLFSAAFWTAAGAFSSIMTTVVFNWYGLGIEWWGTFKATLGAGMLAGAVVLTWVGEATRAHYNLIAGLCGAGVLMLAFAVCSVPWLGAVLGVGIGACGVWIAISANTQMQRIVPDGTRGRVFGIVDLVNMSGMVLATFVLGIVEIPNLDVLVGWILGATGAVLLGMGVLLWRHHLRRFPEGPVVSTTRWFNEVFCKLWHRLQREGICTVPVHGPCIIVANHTSGMDPCFIAASCPNRVFGYLIAEEYTGLPVFRHLIRAIGCIHVRRDGQDVAAAKQALRALREGRALGVFIQGRIPAPGEPHEPRDGAAVLALRSGAPVIPVHISGVHYTDSLVWCYFRRQRVRIRYGRAVDLGAFDNVRERTQITAATQHIWNAVQALAPADGRVFL